MTDNIKLPPLPPWMERYEIPDDNFEGGRANLDSRMRSYALETVRLNATVPEGWKLVPVDALKCWRDAFAEELSAWGIDPPLHHVQTSHDEIEAVLSAAPAAPAAQSVEDAVTWQELESFRKRHWAHWNAPDNLLIAHLVQTLRTQQVTAPAAPQPAQTAPDASEKELLQAIQERDAADDYIDALLDEVLGTDRPEWSSVYGHADAMEQVREMMHTLMKPSIDKAWDRFQSAAAPAAPQPAQQERRPLTESAIQQIGLDMPASHHPGWLIEFARAIERAHGITED